jgi:hypothetical protein
MQKAIFKKLRVNMLPNFVKIIVKFSFFLFVVFSLNEEAFCMQKSFNENGEAESTKQSRSKHEENSPVKETKRQRKDPYLHPLASFLWQEC